MIVSLLICSGISSGTNLLLWLCVCRYILHAIFFVATLFGKHWVKHLVFLDQPVLCYNNKVVFPYYWAKWVRLNHPKLLDHINCKVYVVTYVYILNNKSKNHVIGKNNITYLLQCIILNLVMMQFLWLLMYFFQNAFWNFQLAAMIKFVTFYTIQTRDPNYFIH